ncbi:MAG: general secretion pathway protein GspK [Candidatus Omnitrophota bacterium]
MALWVMIFLSLFVFSVGYSVQQKIRSARKIHARAVLRDAAGSAVEKVRAMVGDHNPSRRSWDGLADDWSQSMADFRDIVVGEARCTVMKNPFVYRRFLEGDRSAVIEENAFGVIDEESKINLNHVKDRKVLTRLFEKAAELSSDQAVVAADSILDFRDVDDHLNTSGAEKKYYQSLPVPYLPKDGDFHALEELLYVRGIDAETFKKVNAYLTVHGAPQVNINTTSEVVLAALGFSRAFCDKIITYRKGRDQRLGSRDDQAFVSTEDIVEKLDDLGEMNDEEKNELRRQIQSAGVGVVSRNFLVSVLAWYPGRSDALWVQSVISKSGLTRSWKEKYMALEKEKK